MKFSTRRTLAAIVAASCLAIPATASATPYSPPTTTQSDAAQSGTAGKTNASIQPQTGSSIQPQTSGKRESTFPSQGFSGDNPADHPGMSRAPQYDAPTTIEVVRPERTIVRDVDRALPLILSSAALILVFAAAATVLVRARMVPRPGRSH